VRTGSPHLIHARAPPTIRSADTTSSPGRNAPVGTEAMRFASTHPMVTSAHVHATRSTKVVGPVRNQVWTPKVPRMPRATKDNGSTTMRTANAWMIAPVMPKKHWQDHQSQANCRYGQSRWRDFSYRIPSGWFTCHSSTTSSATGVTPRRGFTQCGEYLSPPWQGR
jgi:hypothetical protein